MSILQRQVIQSLNGLSDDNLRFLLEMIQRFMKPSEKKRKMLTSWLWIKKLFEELAVWKVRILLMQIMI